MLTEEERAEYVELEEGKWTMSGYGPESEEGERLNNLRTKMWEQISLAELFREGNVSVGKFNRKDPYEDMGYQGHFNVEFDSQEWDAPMTYRPFFDLNYEEQVLELSAGETTETVKEGEEVLEIRSSQALHEAVNNYLEI